MGNLLIVYTGDGKGKTTAALGSALRAWGHSMRVLIVQFMKGDIESGEQRFKQEKFSFFIPPWKGFLKKVGVEEQQHFAEILETTHKKISKIRPDFIVLDELCVALAMGLCEQAQAERLIKDALLYGHVVVTGRNCPDWLMKMADTVTEIAEEAHPFRKGQKARPGIEF